MKILSKKIPLKLPDWKKIVWDKAKKKLPQLLVFLLLVAAGTFADAQATDYSSEAIKERQFDKAAWKKVKKGLSFNQKPEKETEKKEEAKEEYVSPTLSETTKDLMTYIAICILILIGVFFVLKLMTGSFIANPKIKKDQKKRKEFTVEEVEENLHESDLDIFLRQTLANKSYKLAIRVYYLMIIKELSLSNFIRWSKDKTNRQYVGEMRSHETFDSFRDLTRTFERVWYGDYNIEQADFAQIKPRFEQYVKTLRA